MKNVPTLADDIIKTWSKPKYCLIDPNNFLANNIAAARKFVMDEEMSAYLSDVARAGPIFKDGRIIPNEEFEATIGIEAAHQKAIDWLEGLRTMSRLPHKITWIEYDNRAKVRRLKELGGGVKIDDVADRLG